jgi:hypothetical protein
MADADDLEQLASEYGDAHLLEKSGHIAVEAT